MSHAEKSVAQMETAKYKQQQNQQNYNPQSG
jgi:hypothetical protein